MSIDLLYPGLTNNDIYISQIQLWLGDVSREEMMGLITRSPILYKNILIIYNTNLVIVFLIRIIFIPNKT